jgi:hypothetical protein
MQGGIDSFTREKICLTRKQLLAAEVDLLGSTFDNLRDPITRVFFDSSAGQVIRRLDNFSQGEEFKGTTGTQNTGTQNNSNSINEIDNASRVKEIIQNSPNPLG